MKKIAVIGATGMLGKPVVEQLVKAGFTVSALVRNIEAAQKVLPDSVELVQGNISNADDLDKFLKDKEIVYLNLSVAQEEKKTDFHTETDGLKKLIPIATKHGVKRLAFLSSLVMNYQGMNGFNWWVFDVKKEAVELVKNSGIAYTIFYPSTFMESFFLAMNGNRLGLAGDSVAKLHYIAGEDYGKMVAKSFAMSDNTNKEYAIQGIDVQNGEEGAAIFAKYYKKKNLKVSKMPLGVLKFLGIFSTRFDYLSYIVDALNKYPEKFEGEQAWKELGKPKMTIKEFAEKA